MVLHTIHRGNENAVGSHVSSQNDVTAPLVYHWCVARTNIDIDETACAAIMRRYHLSSKRAAVNFALRSLAAEPMDIDDARAMRGSGWEGDLDDLRASRVS